MRLCLSTNAKKHIRVRAFIFKYLKCLKVIIIICTIIFALACTAYIIVDSNNSNGRYFCIFLCIATLLSIILSLIISFSIVNSLKYEWKNMLELDAINDFEKEKFKPLKSEVEKLKSLFDDDVLDKLKTIEKTELLGIIDRLHGTSSEKE